MQRLKLLGATLRYGLGPRLLGVFLLLALTISVVFVVGLQYALKQEWHESGPPLIEDYVNRLVAQIGTPPDLQQAQKLAQTLPLFIDIKGPSINWHSDDQFDARRRHASSPRFEHGGPPWLRRQLDDGHVITLRLSELNLRDSSSHVGMLILLCLLMLTACAYAYIRWLLRPLIAIRAGTARFGRGEFDQPIAVVRRDELAQLAREVNAMAASIHQMLEAKRGLLLAISHELRSPLTRARLHVELLPTEPPIEQTREALLGDLALMRDLISDLLESERLGGGHEALNRHRASVAQLAELALLELQQADPEISVQFNFAKDLPEIAVDTPRIRLLLRNLMHNAQRYSAQAQRPELSISCDGEHLCIQLRDYGPGVPDSALTRLAEPFFRTDSARTRSQGGVGLGLHLCQLIAQAHKGRLHFENAHPGLRVTLFLPCH